ncbi:MAG: hypothetical protein COW65_13320 [Cytophagales bacterium CG18_big_fil_WC_8_21_14_2_50_42_9]|nr:MAG: hypothetical protein COW65_13320 [Cytophagales bacterium CG18_big_fil_WC_8_21_14_2_50_42_9]
MAQATQQETISSKEIIDKMFSSIRQLRTLKFIMRDWERRENRNREGEQHIKVNTNPFWVYAYIAKPSKGVEALYRQGENNNKHRMISSINPKTKNYIQLVKRIGFGRQLTFTES